VSIFPPTLANHGFPELSSFDWQSPFVVPAAERPEIPVTARSAMQKLGRQLCESLAAPAPQRFLLHRMLVYQLLLALPRVPTAAAAGLPEDGWARINRAVELVFRQRRYVSSSEAAKECALSHKALNALFGRAVGVSFAKFALRYRLQGAASRLLESSDPVKAIARDWGFVDASHFHASFRASYGCSPARYRELAALGQTERPLTTSPSRRH
jgi:AraC-like DNA-binding protein